jgi:hypothetical protein
LRSAAPLQMEFKLIPVRPREDENERMAIASDAGPGARG